jgi:hypothetical protein
VETDQRRSGQARSAAVGSYRISQGVPIDASNQRLDGHIQMSGSWSARQSAGEVVKVSCGSA